MLETTRNNACKRVFVMLATLFAIALSAGILASPTAYATETISGNTLTAADISSSPSLETQVCKRADISDYDIALYDLNGSTDMLSNVCQGKKHIIIVGRYGCGNTRSIVSQANTMLGISGYDDIDFLVLDVDNDADSFKSFAGYQSDRLRFYTGADYSSWAFNLYGAEGSVTLPFLFAIDADGTIFSMGWGPHNLGEFISKAFYEESSSDDTDPVDGTDPVDDTEPIAVSPNVAARTQEQIIARMAKDDVMLGIEDTFATEPVLNNTVGELSDETKTLGLGMLNTVRYIAGLDDATLSSDYGKEAQAAAFVNRAINTMTHYPDASSSKPSGMSDSVWNLGCKAASNSNLAYNYMNLSVAIVDAWMSDASGANITSVGHRRWCLNPAMGATGFGVADYYYAMYSSDESAAGTQSNVVWPAQNMPYEFFHSYDPWSISVGEAIRNPSKVKVTLTRKSDGKVWTFDSSSQKYPTSTSQECFFIDDGLDGFYAGQLGCIIFRPDGVSYKAGDEFHVEAANVNGTTIVYDVKFFEGFVGYHASDDDHQNNVLPGDVDGDGYVTITDVLMINSHVIKKTQLTGNALIAADVDGDGDVTIMDVLRVNGHLIGKSSLF